MKFFKNRTIQILIAIFFVGLILKLINYWDNQIFFYDQARDAQRIIEIVRGGIKLVGPETDIKGVFNGPLFYYLLAPFYFISNFNPNFVGLFIILANLSGIFLIYYSSFLLFGKKQIGLIAAFFWAISYEQANFARVISNASFMGISSLIFFLGLILYFIKGNKFGLIISAIGLGMAVNFNLYLGYLILLYPLFYAAYKTKIRIKEIAFSALAFLFFISPLLAAEVKFKFMGTKAMTAYLTNHDASSSIISNLISYPIRISGAIHFGFFPFNDLLGLLFLAITIVFVIFSVRQNKKSLSFLLVWLFSTFPLFFFKSGVLTAEVSNSSIFGAITIVFALFAYKLLSVKKFMVLGLGVIILISVSNLYLFFTNNFSDQNLFALQPLVLSEEKQAIDYTYKSSGGKPFSICAVTNPLFVNTLWSFLYYEYGLRKYNYLPYWSGQKQDLNLSLMPYDSMHIKNRYLIIEPLAGLADFAVRATVYMEDQVSTVVEEKDFGHIVVQKRQLDFDKGSPRDTQNLTHDRISEVRDLISSDQRYSCYNSY